MWGGAISLLITISMAFYSKMIEEGLMDQITSFMNTPFIGSMMKGFGINTEQLKNILGFYVTRNSMLSMLMGSIYAIITATSALALEESNKTIEFLLSRPVSRSDIFWGKLSAFHSNLLILNFIVSLVGFITLELFKTSDYNLSSYLILCTYTYLLHITFGSIGLLISVIPKKGKVVFSTVVGIVIGTYFLEIISNMDKSAEFIGWFSPFTYVDKDVLSQDYNLKSMNVLFFFIVTIFSGSLAYKLYNKRDILI